jgi:vitamin B12 transporter
MYMLRLEKLFFCSALFFSLSAIAQEKDLELDPVTVTSSLSAQLSSKTGRNIIVIKGDELTRLPVNSLDELLRYVPGIEIQARGPMGAQSDIVLRGATFQQALVVVDGVRINDPLTGHFSSYIPIAPFEIERIEILKGASSAIYGSDAVGGVIHVITKSFAQQVKERKEISAQITTGEYGLLNAQAGGFYTDGKTSIGAGFLSNNATGQQQRGTKGGFNLNTISFSINHHLDKAWQIGFRSSIDNRNFAAQNYYTTLLLDTASEKIHTSWNQLSVGYQKEKNKLSLQVGHKLLEDEYRLNPSSAANQNRAKLIQALATYNHQFAQSTSLISGLQFQNRSIRSNDRGNHDVDQAAAFAVLQQSIGQSFTISPALRLDWDERAGSELIPQLNLSYKLNQLQLRGSAGRTIRQADFTERYNNYNRALVTGGRIGNPDLAAETSWSYEAGVDFFLNSNLKISASYFQRDYNELIDWSATAYMDMPRKSNLVSNGRYELAKNVSDVETKGFETDIRYIKTFSNKHRLYTNAGLVVVNSETSEGVATIYLTSYARFLTNFSINYSAPWFSIGVNGLYKNRKPQAGSAFIAKLSRDYFVLNVKAEGFILKEKLSAFVQADNLLDQSYSDILGAIMPGRWLMGGLKLSLSK